MNMQTLSNLLFRNIAPRDIRHVKPPDIKHMDGLLLDICRQLSAEFQLAPPITLHHAIPRVMAGLWAATREAYVADPAGRALREAVCSAISQINQCPYCVDVHIAMLHALGDRDAAEALDSGRLNGLDADTRNAVEWAMATLTPNAAILKSPPFPLAKFPKIIGTALIFHYINRMVHIFLPDSPLPVPSSLGRLKRSARELFGRTVGSTISTRAAGSDPFPLAEESAELPEEFGWARADSRVAAAFALFAKVPEEAGAAHLDPDVMVLVMDRVERWNGESPGMGRGWVEEAIAELPEKLYPSARLALLTALASYQVTDADIAVFRMQHPTDAALIGATTWASFQAMKRISTWLYAPAQMH